MPGRNHARQAAIAALAVATCAVATTADVTIADYYDFDEWAADSGAQVNVLDFTLGYTIVTGQYSKLGVLFTDGNDVTVNVLDRRERGFGGVERSGRSIGTVGSIFSTLGLGLGASGFFSGWLGCSSVMRLPIGAGGAGCAGHGRDVPQPGRRIGFGRGGGGVLVDAFRRIEFGGHGGVPLGRRRGSEDRAGQRSVYGVHDRRA